MGEDGGAVEDVGGDVTGVAGKQGRCEKGFVRGVEEEGVRKQQNADSLRYGSREVSPKSWTRLVNIVSCMHVH